MTDDVLRQSPLFSGVDDDSAAVLEDSMAASSLNRGDVLFNEGDSGNQLYVVIEGKIKLGRTSADGRENLLAILGPGQMFGELSFFDPGPRSATATAWAWRALLRRAMLRARRAAVSRSAPSQSIRSR